MLVFNPLKSASLAHKVVAMVILSLVCLSVALGLLLHVELGNYAAERAASRQEADMRVAWHVLHSYGDELHVTDGKLYAGSRPLNEFFAPVDLIHDLLGVNATIFLGDERIATNVKKPDGSRAVGTRLTPGPVYERTLKQGLPYRGEAEILGNIYLTAYDPIKDAHGEVIGALFVGIPKAEFFAAIHATEINSALLILTIATLVVAACIEIARRMFRPLDALGVATDRLSRADTGGSIPGTDRRDDLGRLARGLERLQVAGREKAQLEATLERQRLEREASALAAAAASADAAAAQQQIVDTLAAGLDRLSQGDLRHRIEQPFPPQYEKLREDFNSALAAVGTTLGAIAFAAEAMRAKTATITSSAAELSDRTQQQAAQLASTTQTLSKVTTQVKDTARAATATHASVEAARARAEESAVIVRKAIAAMGEIEGSSNQIQQIIGVIDEIAFQTNLLALNAAVEAARAGDQGRGFAVVASEVRNLASRSSDAAKQVKTLILRSSNQVAHGTTLVGDTGAALEQIAREVGEINAMVRDISENAIGQASEIAAVDAALEDLDGLTRRNTAMVEEATAASESLAGDAAGLLEQIGGFRLATATPRSSSDAAAHRRRA
jgi:methyl-accepting chemotaxis protein